MTVDSATDLPTYPYLEQDQNRAIKQECGMVYEEVSAVITRLCETWDVLIGAKGQILDDG